MTRSLLRSVARGLVGVLLFAQMAIASYACPGLGAALSLSTPMAPLGQSPDDAGPGSAGAMDPASPNLCAEHCRYGQQSDQVPSITLPGVTLTALYVTTLVPVAAVAPRRAAASVDALVAASRPHTILHCVYRI
ncbi:MAG: hypothetical protein WA210_17685 [Burkholderiaceae bacterium]